MHPTDPSPSPANRGRCPRGRARRGLVALLALPVAAACVEGPETPPEAHEPGPRIRSLLEGGGDPVLAMADGDTIHLGKALRGFYEARDYAPAWTDREGFLERGAELVRQLRLADEEGLDMVAYHRESVEGLMRRAEREDSVGLPVGDLLGNLDVVLTEVFLRYSSDLRRGTLDPREAGLDWRIPREDPTGADFLEEVLHEDDFADALDRLRPSVPFYGRLREALARYESIRDQGGWPLVPRGETLERGSTGRRVGLLRRRLAAEGDPVEAPLVEGAADPTRYDDDLARAVEHFQERHGIDADGRVGAGTLAALNVPVEARIRQIVINLDRWRWLPRELGEDYVFVNVAGFQMAVMENDEPALSMRVVVGKNASRTPLFRDTMEYIVVNPYWNVPESIQEEEIVPAMLRDPGYLERGNYEVLDAAGRVVHPASVNPMSRGWRVRQKPGPGNALGEVKFLFPNDMDIYLHDSPADHLFRQASRAFSHGCIRLERPMELAEYLVEHHTDTSLDHWARLAAADDEKWVTLRDKLPVYITYFTAWADADGTVRFYNDVYERDAAVDRIAQLRIGPRAPSRMRTAALATDG